MALEIGNLRLTAEKLAKELKLSGHSAVRPLVRRTIINNYAQEQGITASAEELQQAADQFRADRNLYSVADTERWLQTNGLTLDDFEEQLRSMVLADKIKRSWSDENVAQAFAQRKVDLDAAEISMIVTPDEAVAAEVRAQIVEEGAEFMLMARDHSQHKSAKWGGYIGSVRRGDLAAPVAAAVFGAQSGDVLGPFATAEGHTLIFVHQLHPADLNETTSTFLRDQLFQEWLQSQVEKAQLNWAV